MLSLSWQLVSLALFLCLSSFCDGFSALQNVGVIGTAKGGSKVCYSQKTPLLRSAGLLGGRSKFYLRGERGALGCKALQDSEQGEQCLVPPDLDQVGNGRVINRGAGCFCGKAKGRRK